MATGDCGLCAVILAAGGSTRLGRPKQLLNIGGLPLIVRAIRLAQDVTADVVVVIGAEHLRIRRVLRRHAPDVSIALNARWRDGLATSLRAGLSSVPKQARAALLSVVDQTELDPDDVQRLARTWQRRPGQPSAACYNGKPGVPAVIPRRYFRMARQLRGDTGARQLLRELTCVRLVDMPNAAFDVDTAADAARLER